MKTPAALILLLTTTCIIFSCKKNGWSPNEGTVLLQVKSNNDDGSISKRNYDRNASDKLVRLRDSSSVGWTDAVTIEYGVDGHVSKANYMDNQGNVLFYIEFEYNADGTVRKRQDQPAFLNLADDYHIYTYDIAGQLVTDSVFARIGSTPNFHVSAVNKFIYTGDNITEAEYYTFYPGSPGLEGRRKFEYDQGVNPYKNMENYFYIFTTMQSVDESKYLSANNVLKQYAADGNEPYELQNTFKYKYNSSNNPWKQTLDVNNVPGTTGWEAEYFYK